MTDLAPVGVNTMIATFFLGHIFTPCLANSSALLLLNIFTHLANS